MSRKDLDVDLMLREVGKQVVKETNGKQTPVCVMDGFPVHIHRMNYPLDPHSHTDGFALYLHGCACEPRRRAHLTDAYNCVHQYRNSSLNAIEDVCMFVTEPVGQSS